MTPYGRPLRDFFESERNTIPDLRSLNTSHRPLDLAKVAEIKFAHVSIILYLTLIIDRALLPELVVFAYRPADEMRINSQPAKRAKSPDFGKFLETSATRTEMLDVGKEEHVLILEFLGGSKNKDAERPGYV